MAKRSSQATPGLTRKQMSRAKREARVERWLLIGTGIVIAIVVGVIAFAFINEQLIVPNKPVATINNEVITVRQFQEQVQFDVYSQLGGQSPSIYGIDGATFAKYMLDAMVDDILIRQKATEMGISVSDADIEKRLQLYFGYDAGAPEPTSTPAPTISKPEGSPTATSTFVYTLTPSPTMTIAPGVTPTTTPTTTATPSSKPTVTITPSPQPTATPLTEQAFNDNLTNFVERAKEVSKLPEARIKELLRDQFRNALLRKKLMDALQISVDDKKTMIHAAHILVATEDEAKSILERLSSGEKFEKLAAELSLDTSSAYKGGDLGWFGPGQQEQTIQDTATNTAVGEVGGPVQTQSGWELIKVYARTEVPMTSDEQDSQRQEKFSETLTKWRDEGNVVIQDFWTEYLPTLLQETPTAQP